MQLHFRLNRNAYAVAAKPISKSSVSIYNHYLLLQILFLENPLFFYYYVLSTTMYVDAILFCLLLSIYEQLLI